MEVKLVLLWYISCALSSAQLLYNSWAVRVRRGTVSGYLQDAMQLFQLRGKQGFLIFVHIDRMIASQSSFEIEGALRSAMERYDDIAVVLCGSEATIDEMRQDDRPFYLSFRAFRFVPGH